MILGLAAVGLGLHFKKPALVWIGGAWAVISLAAGIFVVSQGAPQK